MRIVAIILASLCLLASAALGLARSNTNFKDAQKWESVVGDTQIDKETIAAAKAAGVQHSELLEIKPAALRRGGIGMIGVGVLSLLLLVAIYVKKGVPAIASALVAVASLTVILNPQYDVGSLQAMSARNAALLIGAIALIGALFSYVAERRSISAA
jgi:hypothetical protein